MKKVKQMENCKRWSGAEKRFLATKNGASDRIRTYDKRFTKPLLYP